MRKSGADMLRLASALPEIGNMTARGVIGNFASSEIGR